MSLGHMPKRIQHAFTVLWLIGAITVVWLSITHPFGTELSPFPEAFTGFLVLAVAHAGWRAVTGDTTEQTGGQMRLSDYDTEGD